MDTPLHEGCLSGQVLWGLPRLVVVQPQPLWVFVTGCAQWELHHPLVVAENTVLVTHQWETDLVGHQAKFLAEGEEKEISLCVPYKYPTYQL